MTGKKRPEAADEHISRRVQQRRRDLGMSQEKLGEHLGITFQQIQKYEKGANRISAGRLLKIAEVLHTDTAYFFEGFGDQADANGFAEDEQAAFEAPPREDEAERLLRDFSAVQDRQLRQAILDLVHALSVEARRRR